MWNERLKSTNRTIFFLQSHNTKPEKNWEENKKITEEEIIIYTKQNKKNSEMRWIGSTDDGVGTRFMKKPEKLKAIEILDVAKFAFQASCHMLWTGLGNI